MSDIVERLRSLNPRSATLLEAATELERQAVEIADLSRRLAEAGREIERLREALQWYADETIYDTGQDCPDVLIDGGGTAKRALTTTPPPGSAAG